MVLFLSRTLESILIHSLQQRLSSPRSSSAPSAGSRKHNGCSSSNTSYPGGIGTEVTLTPLGVAANAGISVQTDLWDLQLLLFSQELQDDIDIVTFGIHYNGGGTGTAGNYKNTGQLSQETSDLVILDSDRR